MVKLPNFVPKSGWFWGPTALLTLIVIALSLLPTLARNGLKSFLIAQGVKNITYRAIDVDIFNRELRFKDLRLQSSGAADLYLQQASLKLSLIPLWKNTLKCGWRLESWRSEITTASGYRQKNRTARMGCSGKQY